MELLTWMVGGILMINVIRLYLAIRATIGAARHDRVRDDWVAEQEERWDQIKVIVDE